MDFSVFYAQCQSLPESERQWVDAFYNTVDEAFGEEQDFENLHKVCRLFYGRETSKLSKAQYYRKRKLVIKLYDWLEEQGAVSHDFVRTIHDLKMKDVLSESELRLHYFKNLNEALNFITRVGMSKGLGEYDDLLFIKSIVILAWYQVSVTEMVGLHKSDLIQQTNEVVVGNKKIQIKNEYFAILRRFAELDMHKGFPSHKMQVYASSKFLMRTAKNSEVCPNNIAKTLSRFNAVAIDHGKELSILSLRRNGVFSQVYDSMSEDKSVGVLIKEICQCDTAFSYGYKEFYEKWKFVIVGGDDK